MKLKIVEKKLSKFYSRKYCLLTGNATTSLYLCLKSLGLPDSSRVMIPNSVCPHVPLSIYLAGLKPLFVDIDKKNLSLNLNNIFKNYNKKVKAIIAVHAYGIPCAIDEISKFCNRKKISLIEDAAIAQGIKIRRKMVGSFGRASVLSFGKGKIFDIGTGGAVLTNDKFFFEKIKYFHKKIDKFSREKLIKIAKLSSFHTNIYNKYFINNRKLKVSKIYKKKAIREAKNFLFQFNLKKINKVNFNQKILNTIISKRREKAKYIHSKLGKIKYNFFEIQKIKKNEAPWRANIFFQKEKYRNLILKGLLKKKVKISSWYPSLDLFFQKRKKKLSKFPVSDNLGNKILNIWINHEVKKTYLDEVYNYLKFYKKDLVANN